MTAQTAAMPRVLYRFLVATLVLTLLSLGFAWGARSLGYGLPMASAYYYVPGDLFMDFLGFNKRALLFGSPEFFVKPPGEYVMYPAPLIFPIVHLPIIFLGMFLYRARLKYVALALGVFVGTNLLALWRLGPTIAEAYHWNSVQLQAFGKFYASSDWALGYDHSVFALVKLVTLPWHPDLTRVVPLYTGSVMLGCFLLFVLVIRQLPVVNQVGCLSILSETVSPVSYDYTLVNLYAFFTVLVVFAVDAWRRDAADVPRLRLMLGLFAVVFTPDSFVMVGNARFGAELRCVCLLAMLVVLLRNRLPLPPVGFGATRRVHEAA